MSAQALGKPDAEGLNVKVVNEINKLEERVAASAMVNVPAVSMVSEAESVVARVRSVPSLARVR